ncbi:MAG: creatininase family protein [Candidatus Sumerlaeia bacterium]|nr:creatininase family protein [Candidatus Sumerlaeia bacterium]
MFPRRHFIGQLAAASVGGGAIAAGGRNPEKSAKSARPPANLPQPPASNNSPPTTLDPQREVRLERLRPREIEQAMAACPTLFQPLGTIEWHGLHNIVGLDAVKAHHLCVAAARRGGGLVAPPLYGGIGGLNQPHTFVMEPENEVYSILLRPWVEKLVREAVRQGFRAVILLTGHYGAGQQIVVRELAVRMSRALAIPILGTPEYFLALDAGYLGDHAAWGETSLMMHLDPDSVDLSRLGEPPHRGVGGRDPREATRADGEKLAETIIARLAQLASRMPKWDEPTLRRFIDAEAALVNRQLTLAATGTNAWEGWRNLRKGVLSDYGRLLAEEQFEAIAALTAKM